GLETSGPQRDRAERVVPEIVRIQTGEGAARDEEKRGGRQRQQKPPPRRHVTLGRLAGAATLPSRRESRRGGPDLPLRSGRRGPAACSTRGSVPSRRRTTRERRRRR